MRYCDDNYRYNGRRGCDCCDCCPHCRPCPPCPPPCPPPWPPCPPEPPCPPPCPPKPPVPPIPRCPHDSAQFTNSSTNTQQIAAATTGLIPLNIPVPTALDKTDITLTAPAIINLQPGRYLISYALVAENNDATNDTVLSVGLKLIAGATFIPGTEMTNIFLESGQEETEAISRTNIIDVQIFTQIQLAVQLGSTAATSGAVTIYDASVTIVEICECAQV